MNFYQNFSSKSKQHLIPHSKDNFVLLSCGLETWYLVPGEENWIPGQCLFTSKPKWISEELPFNDGAFWAPTLVSSKIMYYSVASMTSDNACIGMATATGDFPDLTWVN